MLTHIKLIAYRIVHNKSFLITYLVLIPIVIAMAMYFTNNIFDNVRIGIVGNVEIQESSRVQYDYLKDVPKTSQLILNQYDAVLIEKGESVGVMTTKGEEFEQVIKMMVNGQIDTMPDSDQQRGTESNILGFLMMVICLLGVQIYEYYFDERGGVNKRILETSINYWQYMLSHFLIVLTFLFVPAVLIICSAIAVLNITLSITLWQFVLVLLLLCFFAASFGLWINSISKSLEESMMFGNMFAIVGTIVSGGIVQVTDNEIFNQIIQIFPQKQIMTLLSSLEDHLAMPLLEVGYIIVLSGGLIILAIIIEKKKIANR